MQNPSPPTLSPLVAGLFFVASSATGIISALLAHLLSRPKQAADISQSNALTHKTESEAREIDSRIISAAHEQLAQMRDLLQHASVELANNSRTIANQAWDLSVKEAEIKSQAQQIAEAHAELTLLRKPRALLPGGKS